MEGLGERAAPPLSRRGPLREHGVLWEGEDHRLLSKDPGLEKITSDSRFFQGLLDPKDHFDRHYHPH